MGGEGQACGPIMAAEHVRRVGQVPKNRCGMIHSRGWLQDHGVIGNVGHEAFGVAEIQIPRVEQGGRS